MSGAPVTEQAVWNYTVPAPRLQMVVLDTRNSSAVPRQGYLPPDLIGLNRNEQIPAGPLADGRELLFVVSAAPGLGPDVIDSLGWPLAQVAIDAVHRRQGLDGSGVQRANVGSES